MEVAKIESPVAGPNKPEPVAKPTDTARPEWLPQKFKTPEDMAKSYTELEKKLSVPKGTEAPADGVKPEGTKAQETPPAGLEIQKQAEATLESVGLKLDVFEKEFSAHGKLSDESLQKLEKAGISKGMIDVYVDGVHARADKYNAEVTKDIGGREAYAKMAEWAANNVPAEKLEAFNKVVSAGDPQAAALAVQGLYGEYAKTIEPSLLRGGGTSDTSGDVYRSVQQLIADQSNPLYKKDPAFRASVMEKLKRSAI